MSRTLIGRVVKNENGYVRFTLPSMEVWYTNDPPFFTQGAHDLKAHCGDKVYKRWRK
jgi:hypothetical protein